jgi:hypothetical protein
MCYFGGNIVFDALRSGPLHRLVVSIPISHRAIALAYSFLGYNMSTSAPFGNPTIGHPSLAQRYTAGLGGNAVESGVINIIYRDGNNFGSVWPCSSRVAGPGIDVPEVTPIWSIPYRSLDYIYTTYMIYSTASPRSYSNVPLS